MRPFDELLRTLDGVAVLGGTPWWIQAYGLPGEGGTLIIDERFERLLGFTAPPGCWALGVAATCRITPEGPVVDGHSTDGSVCLLSGRDGLFASRVHGPGGDTLAEGIAAGKLVDLLVRPFGLPTEPPPRPASDMVTLLWLSAIHERLDERPERPPTWGEVLGLHPACETLGGYPARSPDGRAWWAETFALLDAASAAWDWAFLRRLATTGRAFEAVVPQEVAAWMDDGMFARWILDAMPPPRRLLTEVRARLPSAVRRRLTRCVSHVLATAPPSQ